MPRVSVVIPAYRSNATVAGCLDALRAQTFRDFEVIVVNSSQGDDTPRIVDQGYREVKLIQSAVRLLPHAARNHGVDEASGAILVFTDPDCRARPDWLAWLVAGCDAGHPAVGGPVLPLGDGGIEVGLHLVKFHMCLGGAAGDRPLHDLPTANACYTRQTWHAVGPFDPDVFCGDALLARRARNRGYRAWFEPRAVVAHVGTRAIRSMVPERFRRGREYRGVCWQRSERSGRRLALELASAPALLPLALVRAGRNALAGGHGRAFVRTLPLQLGGHAAWWAGETVARLGHAVGARAAAAHVPAAPPGSRPDVVIVGAGPAGLAAAVCLQHVGKRVVVLERGASVASSWQRHYETLRLHTTRSTSSLPFMPFPDETSAYPTRDQLVAYLRRYQQHFGVDVRSGQDVVSVVRGDGRWTVRTSSSEWVTPIVVIAAGFNRTPVRATWPGLDLYRGHVVHSSEYCSGAAFRGQRVLVVGLGNSGADLIADLHGHGSRVAVSVRSPVFLVPKEIAGANWRSLCRLVPDVVTGVGGRFGRPGADAAARLSAMLWWAVQRARFGSLASRGVRLQRPRQIADRWRVRRPPLTDGPFVELIRRGEVDVLPGVRAFERDGVVFEDGRRRDFDFIILATGFRCDLGGIIENPDRYTDDQGVPLAEGAPAAGPDLYFCGYRPELAQIARSARSIANAVAGFVTL